MQSMSTPRVKEAHERLTRVFSARPGIRLTTAAAARIACLDHEVCRVLLRTLTDTRVIEQRASVHVRGCTLQVRNQPRKIAGRSLPPR